MNKNNPTSVADLIRRIDFIDHGIQRALDVGNKTWAEYLAKSLVESAERLLALVQEDTD